MYKACEYKMKTFMIKKEYGDSKNCFNNVLKCTFDGEYFFYFIVAFSNMFTTSFDNTLKILSPFGYSPKCFGYSPKCYVYNYKIFVLHEENIYNNIDVLNSLLIVNTMIGRC